ncbi:hypothetical protein DENSPDRAFT_305199 [Dentipellis sp. KUC8613]|nr:hypothetical protein DENSPDRAFT_305199 [Dentipellis sp. KUC8613]
MAVDVHHSPHLHSFAYTFISISSYLYTSYMRATSCSSTPPRQIDSRYKKNKIRRVKKCSPKAVQYHES